MCERLSQLRDAMEKVACGFDPATCPTEVARALEDAAAIEKMAATVKALAAGFLSRTGAWKRAGQRSPAHHLARVTGTGVGAAAQALEVGRRLAQVPEVGKAAREGRLSGAQVSAITQATAVDPTAAASLLDLAARASLSELSDHCARVRAQATDLEEAHARIHATRRLRAWSDPEGRWHLRAEGTPEHGAQVMAALSPLADRAFQEARAGGRREHPEAYAFDGLVALATEATSATDQGEQEHPGGAANRGRRRGAPVKLLVRVDLEALLRGYPVLGETCELAGYGPIPVSVARDLADQGCAFLAAILTRGKALVGVAHLGRRPSAHQQSALEWLYPSCAVEGCPAQAHLETDHRVDWARTHLTVLDWLDRLCRFHHRLKTEKAWSLVEGRGKRAFVSPDDPRHPRRRRRREGEGDHDVDRAPAPGNGHANAPVETTGSGRSHSTVPGLTGAPGATDLTRLMPDLAPPSDVPAAGAETDPNRFNPMEGGRRKWCFGPASGWRST